MAVGSNKQYRKEIRKGDTEGRYTRKERRKGGKLIAVDSMGDRYGGYIDIF